MSLSSTVGCWKWSSDRLVPVVLCVRRRCAHWRVVMEKPCSVQEVFWDMLVEKCCVPVGKGNSSETWESFINQGCVILMILSKLIFAYLKKKNLTFDCYICITFSQVGWKDASTKKIFFGGVSEFDCTGHGFWWKFLLVCSLICEIAGFPKSLCENIWQAFICFCSYIFSFLLWHYLKSRVKHLCFIVCNAVKLHCSSTVV